MDGRITCHGTIISFQSAAISKTAKHCNYESWSSTTASVLQTMVTSLVQKATAYCTAYAALNVNSLIIQSQHQNEVNIPQNVNQTTGLNYYCISHIGKPLKLSCILGQVRRAISSSSSSSSTNFIATQVLNKTSGTLCVMYYANVNATVADSLRCRMICGTVPSSVHVWMPPDLIRTNSLCVQFALHINNQHPVLHSYISALSNTYPLA